MQRSLKKDLEFGLAQEEPVRQILKRNFTDDADIINTKDLYNDEYCKYDYEGITTKRRYEVKSRTNKKYQFATTILPVHKITTETTKNGLYIIFNFTDKCSYIIYDKNVFSKFDTKIFKIYRDGKYDPPTLHYMIPVNLLTDCI
jgi:hypothetical protein